MPSRPRLLVPAAVVLALALALSGTRDVGDSPSAFHTAFGRGPTVVLVHGLGSRASHWLPTARRLARTHRVVLAQLPGHGESALPDPFSLEACAEALDQVLAKQKPESTVIVAHGFGGLIALHEVLVAQFIASQKVAPAELVLDIDASDVPLHGNQELSQFHAYYDHHCYLPLYVFCGQAMLACVLTVPVEQAMASRTQRVYVPAPPSIEVKR